MLPVAGASATTGVVNTTASGTQIQWTATAGGAALEWISGAAPAGGFTLAGTITAHIRALESNVAANCGGRLRLFKRTLLGIETEILGGPWNDGVEFTASNAAYDWTGTPTSTVFIEDDRLICRYYITNIGTMAGGHTCTLHYDGADAGTADSYVQINETVTFKSDMVATQSGVESLSQVSPNLRSTQSGAESLSQISPNLRATQSGIEVISANALKLQTSQIGVEVLSVNSLSYSLPAAAGAFSLSGQAASLLAARRLAAGLGAFALTGQGAVLSVGRRLRAEAGAFALTGEDARLGADRVLHASAGVFALTGQNAALSAERRLQTATGAFTLAGKDAYFLYAPSVVQQAIARGIEQRKKRKALRHYRLPARVGSFVISGFPSTLRAMRVLSARAGEHLLTSAAVRLSTHRRTIAQSGIFNLSGQHADFAIDLGPELQAVLLSLSFSLDERL